MSKDEVIFEIVKTVVIAGVGGLWKMYLDIRSLRSDLDSAFCKIRRLETKNGIADPPGTKAPE